MSHDVYLRNSSKACVKVKVKKDRQKKMMMQREPFFVKFIRRSDTSIVNEHDGHAQIFGDGELVHPLGIPDFFHSVIVDCGMHVSKSKARTAFIKSNLTNCRQRRWLILHNVWIEILKFCYIDYNMNIRIIC